MLDRFLQQDPPPATPPPAPDPGPIHIDISGLADGIWQALTSHLPELGDLIWKGIHDNLPMIAAAVWTELVQWLMQGISDVVSAFWAAVWGSGANILTQLPANLTYSFPPYRALVDADPLLLTAGVAILALVLFGLRMSMSAFHGADAPITHIFGRLIPSVPLAIFFPVLVVRGTDLLNQAATDLASSRMGQGMASGIGTLMLLPIGGAMLGVPILLLGPILLLWLILLWYSVKLIIRMAYALYRFLVALLFGPLAIGLWAIPWTEWVTALWVRELVGWAVSPLLVAAALAMAIPMAVGQGGIIPAFLFGIAGFQAAHDLVGLLGGAMRGGRSLFPFTAATIGSQAAHAGMAAATGGAAIAANQLTTIADQYGYD